MPGTTLPWLAISLLAFPQQPSSPLRPIYTGQSLGISLSGGIASADLDGDGDLDLIVWSEFGSQVRFHLGTGSGTFASDAWPSLTLTPLEYLTSLAVGDFDGDGTPDLAVLTSASQAGRLHAFRGDAAGTFTLYATMDFAKPGEQLVPADADGDGRADLFALRDPWPKVTFLRSLGPVGFAAPKLLEPPAGYFGARDYAVGDTTGDGLPDVLCLLSAVPPAVFQYANDGAGGFLAPVKAFDVPLTTDRLLLANLRGDGVLHAGADAGSAVSGASFYWFENDGSGAFEYRERFEGMRFPDTDSPLLPVRDLDGDGRQEWIVERSQGEYSAIAAQGAGVAVGNLLTPPGQEWVAAGDFDSDGNEDFVTSTYWSELLLSPGDGARGLRGLVASPSVPGYHSTRLVDFDVDGRLDLVALDGQHDALHLYRGLGDGRFEWFQSLDTEDRPSLAVLGDFDGDGRLDLGVIEGEYPMIEFLIQGRYGRFESAGAVPRDDDAYSFYDPVTLDSDGDGRDELAVIDAVDGLVLLAGLHEISGARLLAAHGIPGVGSLDVARPAAEGWPEALELVAPGTVSQWSLWLLAQPLSTTAMSLTEYVSLPVVDPDGAGPDFLVGSVLIDDQDGDGHRDVWSTIFEFNEGLPGQTCSAVWNGLPSGGFAPPAAERTPLTLWSLRADDFDGDGATDRAYLFSYWSPFAPPPRLQVHRPALGGVLAVPEAYPWAPIEFGDLDGDGFLDFVHKSGTSIVAVLNLSGR